MFVVCLVVAVIFLINWGYISQFLVIREAEIFTAFIENFTDKRGNKIIIEFMYFNWYIFSGAEFFGSRSFITLSINSLCILSKQNYFEFYMVFLILTILGCMLYFFITHNIASLPLPVLHVTPSFFCVLIILLKKYYMFP